MTVSDEKVTVIYGDVPSSGTIIEYKGISLVCVRPGHPKYDGVWAVLEESLGLKCGTCGGPLTQGPAGRTEKRCYNAACVAQRSQPQSSDSWYNRPITSDREPTLYRKPPERQRRFNWWGGSSTDG